MSQLILMFITLFISTFALSAENQNRIKCSLQGAEEKVYYFDTASKRYRLSVLEKGRPKTSLSRQIQQHTHHEVEATKKVFHTFQIDDRTEISVDMDTGSRRGTGEIKLRARGHTKKFDDCEFVTAASEHSI